MTTLSPGSARCNDAGCHEKDDCARWLLRGEVPPHQVHPSLFPYDVPLCNPCPMKIVMEPSNATGSAIEAITADAFRSVVGDGA